MRITLYKSCRLNQSYCEVLDTIAPHTHNGQNYVNALEAYLHDLNKYIITSEEPVYLTNTGKFSFEYDFGQGGNIYEYNYMKVEDTINNITRYFFINSITLVNGIAVAEYTEDIWANYSKSMHLRKSLLTRSRALKYGNKTIPFYKLGMEYEGNEPISYSSLPTLYDNGTNDGKCILIAKVQFYQLVVDGKVGNTFSRVVAFSYKKSTTGHPQVDYNQIEIGLELTQLMTEIKKNQSSTFSFVWDSTYKSTYKIVDDTSVTGNTNWYYEIDNFVVVPYKFGLELSTNSVGFKMGLLPTGAPGTDSWFYEIEAIDVERSFFSSGQMSNARLIPTTIANITHNFKNIGIGTYSNVYEVVENGTNYYIPILISCDDYNFDIYVNIQNHLINITDNYIVDVPFEVQSADITQQKKTARELEKLTNEINLVKSTFTLASGAVQTAGSLNLNYLASSNFVERSTAQNNVAGGISKIVGGATGIASSVKQLDILNRPLYRTSKGTFARSVGLSNAYYGLVLFTINADNDTEVKANIDNAGYVVNEVVDDVLQDMAQDQNKPSYDVVQFDYVNNYGSFPENVRQQLVEILSNGFKIWYNTTDYMAS